MRGQIGKWGNSLAIRIPGPIAQQVEFREGKAVDVSVEAGRVVIAPAEEEIVYDIDRLIADITDDNRHEEILTGEAVGNEFP
jgi:antitoxin MazE